MKIQKIINNLSENEYAEECLIYIVKYGVATEEEISLVTAISGWNKKSMDGIIKYKTGLNNLRELIELNIKK